MRHKKYIRRQVFEKFSGRCAYCGCEISIDSFQVDHLVPDVRNNAISNLMPSCRVCNFWKSNLSIEEFRQKIYAVQHVFAAVNSKALLLCKFGLLFLEVRPVVFFFEKNQ